MQYYIEGNTYDIKEDLKAWGCKWDGKRWKTPDLVESSYRVLKGLCIAVGASIYPRELTGDAKKIQEILNR